MTKLSTEEIEAIRERVEKATAGPWEYNAKIDSITAEDDYGSFIIADDTETVVDAEFIAHAREDIPKLLAEIERLKEIIECAYDAIADQYDDDVWFVYDMLKKEAMTNAKGDI